MFENLKEGDKIKVGEMVLTCVGELDSDYEILFRGLAVGEMYFTPEDLELMGATLVKGPRTMSVWEWRGFPDVRFSVGDNHYKELWWEAGDLKYFDGEDEYRVRDVRQALLESIGTEVLDGN